MKNIIIYDTKRTSLSVANDVRNTKLKGNEYRINKHSYLITFQFSERGIHTVIQIIIFCGQYFGKRMSKIL